ncbi:MAG: N-acetylmuramoyl-L-alanine amidase [Candidatus Hydrogenedentales bacterium]|jgi:N-acetylmuramoyl-L-alanine amidase
MRYTLALACGVLAVAAPVWAAQGGLAGHVRESIDEKAFAVLRGGRVLMLECYPPKGAAAQAYFKKYLSNPSSWTTYAGKGGVAVPYNSVNQETQRAMLLAVFKQDYVDEKGWHHTVLFSGRDQETVWNLAEWLTGKGTNHDAILKVNGLRNQTLRIGQEILFPKDLLLQVMRKVTPKPVLKLPQESMEEQEQDLGKAAQALRYVTRNKKQYASYRLNIGEALYTAVVVRFTDYRENADILKACELIQRESGITDVHDIDAGSEVLIPVDMLSDRFQPTSTPERQRYEDVVQEATRLRGQVRSKDLEGIVVILDPGHGGRDPGTKTVNHDYRLYEDEINYDIACRIKRLLETQTRAKVHMTMLDPAQKYQPSEATFFELDQDERVLTTPHYRNDNATVSVNLRWYLANSIYRREVKAGVDPRKIIFTSIHCDALFNDKLRGSMVYIPGASRRREVERGWPPKTYQKYKEYQEQPESKTTAAERRRDEALSRNFATTLLDELGRAQIKRHSVGDPIRSVIRQSGGKEYVPAVLRNTQVPTKVLIECANLTNPIDCKWVSQPWWRERFAEAYVEALKAFYR